MTDELRVRFKLVVVDVKFVRPACLPLFVGLDVLQVGGLYCEDAEMTLGRSSLSRLSICEGFRDMIVLN